jgi:predicted permease
MSSRLEFRLRGFAAKLFGFFSERQHDDELDAEIHEHLKMLTDGFVAQGMTREEAARVAHLQFGNSALLHEERRELQTLTSVEALWLDLRYGLRTIWRNRAFAGIAIATLALGIGSATAIFSVVDNVLLAPFPYKGAERIVFARIHGAQQAEDAGRQGYTANEVLEIAESNHVFDAVIATQEDLVLYKHGEGTEQLYGAHVTSGAFEFFGMPALHGRLLQPSDYESGAPPVFVMRYKTWKQKFNSDLSLLNRTFVLNGNARTLVGVMPPRFGWYDAEVYIPEKLARGPATEPAGFPGWFLVGRLKSGVSSQQAEADLTVIAKRLATIYPKDYPAQFTILIKHLGDSVVGRFAATLYTVLAAVGLLLLIACSNVANLMLARATTREKEFALRAALGAGRARLIRLLMVESLLLALGGAALGVLVAWGGLKSLVLAMPQNSIPAETVIQLNAPALAFALCMAILTPLIFGLAPAFQSSRQDCNDALRDCGKGVSGGFGGKWFRDMVVVSEVALSLILLIGAGLLMRSFVALREVNLGLRADHVFQTMLILPEQRYKTAEQVTRFFRPLLAQVKALPGVVNAAESSSLPSYSGDESKMEIAGKTHTEDWRTLFQQVSQEYFRTLRIEVRRGRTFSEAEVDDARKVAVVNEMFVRKYLPKQNPIGQHVRVANLEGVADPSFEIIGVVGDVTNRGLQAPTEPELWMPYSLTAMPSQVLVVRTAQDAGTMLEVVRKQVWAADSGVALAYSSTLEDFIGERMYAGPRFGFVVMTIFGCVGLLLVTGGVYSVLAYSTARKTHEIGIRMALGAKGADVLRLVVGTGLRLAVGGIAIGLAISLMLARVIGSDLVGIKSYDPITLTATTLLLILTATAASWIPARRAARVDPVIALRYQ